MTWAKFDDNFPEHPKIRDLPDLAFRLHVSAICFSSRHLTDGFVTQADVRRFADVPSSSRSRSISILVDSGIWQRTRDGYQVHDYLEYNPSREQVMARREAQKKGGKEGAQKRWRHMG